MTDIRLTMAKNKRPKPMPYSPKVAADKLLSGEATLGDVLGLTAEDRAELRLAAHGFLVEGYTAKAREVLEVLDLIGDRHPLLLALRAACFEQEGDHKAAAELFSNAQVAAKECGIDLPDITPQAQNHNSASN